MKVNAYQRYKYTADLYKFVVEKVGDISTTKYYFVGNIAINATVDASGRMTIKSEQPLAIGWILVNVKDVNKEPILEDIRWQISSLEPVMSSFNNVEAYRMRAVKFQGDL